MTVTTVYFFERVTCWLQRTSALYVGSYVWKRDKYWLSAHPTHGSFHDYSIIFFYDFSFLTYESHCKAEQGNMFGILRATLSNHPKSDRINSELG